MIVAISVDERVEVTVIRRSLLETLTEIIREPCEVGLGVLDSDSEVFVDNLSVELG